MSSKTKIIIGVLVVIVVVLGVWFLLPKQGNAPASPVSQNSPASSNGSSSGLGNNPTNSVSAQDISDASLNQDLGSADVQMQTLTTDNSNIDQSLNDKPISQAQ